MTRRDAYVFAVKVADWLLSRGLPLVGIEAFDDGGVELAFAMPSNGSDPADDAIWRGNAHTDAEAAMADAFAWFSAVANGRYEAQRRTWRAENPDAEAAVG